MYDILVGQISTDDKEELINNEQSRLKQTKLYKFNFVFFLVSFFSGRQVNEMFEFNRTLLFLLMKLTL